MRTAFTGALLFALLTADLLLGGPVTTRIDPAVLSWLAAHRSEPLTALMKTVSQVHSTLGIDVMLGITALAFASRRRWRTACWIIACVQGAMLLNVALKLVLARHRPMAEAALVHLDTFSFPSGHALAATVWWGCLWVVLRRSGPARQRAWLLAIPVAMVLATCLSRVYLGAHYLSDVAAGVGEGLVWLAAWRLTTQLIRSVLSAPQPAKE